MSYEARRMALRIDDHNVEIFGRFGDEPFIEMDIRSMDNDLALTIKLDPNINLDHLEEQLTTMRDEGMSWEDIKVYYEL